MKAPDAIFFERQPFWHPIFRTAAPAVALTGLGAWGWGAWTGDFAAAGGLGFQRLAIGAFLAFAAVVIVLLYRRTGLEVTVSPEGAHVRFFPFARRVIRAGDIRAARVRRYRPMEDYGGWGVRRGPGGSAYLVSGDRGVEIVTRAGERILVGSSRPEQLAEALWAVVGGETNLAHTRIETADERG